MIIVVTGNVTSVPSEITTFSTGDDAQLTMSVDLSMTCVVPTIPSFDGELCDYTGVANRTSIHIGADLSAPSLALDLLPLNGVSIGNDYRLADLNPPAEFVDHMYFSNFFSSPPANVDGLDLWGYDVSFGDSTLTAFQNTALSNVVSASIDDFDFGNMWLYFDPANTEPRAVIDFGSYTATTVPVPQALWLFGSALGVLGWMRRKTR